MLKIEKLKKEYKLGKSNIVTALAGVSFEMGEGDIVALVGPSGSGKSTMLSILGGLDRDFEGEVIVDNKDIREYESNFYRRYIVGTIFQQFYLNPSLTVAENILLPTIFSGKHSNKDTHERLEYLLDKVGLNDRREHRPKELSGGQAQRVAIARALISSPRIVLADEPTGNLDSKTGNEIVELLFKLNEQEQTTMVIVTHDLELIDKVPDKLFLKDGKFINKK
ncbi:ABC transporter ATP-binding protein [Candidatus Dojkabacteria bacterium]|uniref:ABC transporter ATP-binding protein n=1 Tax=Candidatus Dojkabacteria bacterium TaxID=2099670 RepID=A0A955L5H9_9BACT|nr:ABC transporter ATP-binding protein [Candidatus Dojkabacteria bacterium]